MKEVVPFKILVLSRLHGVTRRNTRILTVTIEKTCTHLALKLT